MPPLNMTERRVRVHGVDLQADASPMPDPNATTTLSFQSPAKWDSDGFFNPAQPSRVTIPSGLRGRYSVRLTIRWSLALGAFTINDRDNGFFYAELATDADPDGRFQETRISVAPVANSTKTVLQVCWDGLLAPGNHIGANVQYDLPRPAMLNAWLTMHRLGAQV
jgi:hypothetical protein